MPLPFHVPHKADHMLGRGDRTFVLLYELLHISKHRSANHKCDYEISKDIVFCFFSLGPSGVHLVRLLRGLTAIPHVIPYHRGQYPRVTLRQGS
jgi:hypothetical protein